MKWTENVSPFCNASVMSFTEYLVMKPLYPLLFFNSNLLPFFYCHFTIFSVSPNTSHFIILASFIMQMCTLGVVWRHRLLVIPHRHCTVAINSCNYCPWLSWQQSESLVRNSIVYISYMHVWWENSIFYSGYHYSGGRNLMVVFITFCLTENVLS